MALAGALACQKNSYLKELNTKVVSCKPSPLTLVVDGKKQKLNAFEVVLEDTVLFPEGGGQPDDRGTINGVEVLRIIRKGGDAIHYLPTPIDPATEVELLVDWTRRWDNMQQHSGQHLITAIADGHFGYPTTSWSLGDKTSFIELDTPSMTDEQVQCLEKMVNEKIFQGVRMYPTLYESIEDPKLKEVRTRGLPEDHVGPVRVVTIEGVENNMCCGTHLANLAHLQSIKILGVEKGKKGKTNLVFVAGQRVLDYLARCHENEKAFTALLKGGPAQHVELLTKLQNSFKIAQKNATTLLRDVAILEAQKFKALQDRPKFFFLHRKEGDNEFMNIIHNEINDPEVTLFLSTGDEKGVGMFLMTGSEEQINKIQTQVAEILEAKGANKNGRFQGRANKLSKRHLVEKLIQESCC